MNDPASHFCLKTGVTMSTLNFLLHCVNALVLENSVTLFLEEASVGPKFDLVPDTDNQQIISNNHVWNGIII